MEEGVESTPQPAAPPAVQNPLLDRIKLPGETFTLPSGGLFYNNGELDESVRDAEVHVHPMTAIDEIVIKTPDMLFSGDAVRQVFARCIPQVKKPDMLLAKDVDFLMVCLRKVSYGDEIQIEHKHDCENAKNHTYSVDVTQFIKKAKRIDPTTVAKEFTVEMPNGQVVMIQPIRFKDFVRVMQLANTEEQIEDPEKLRDMLVESVSNLIVKVDDISDNQMIREWLAQVPPMFMKKVNERVDQTLEWGPEFGAEVKCADCGTKMNIIAPMNPLAFFI